MSRRVAHLLLLPLLSCDAEPTDAGATGDAPAACAALRGPSTPRAVLRIAGRSAFSPDVHATAGGLVAWVPSVIFGDGGLYRAESTDGLAWSDPERVFGERGRVLQRGGESLLYYGRWEGTGPSPFQRIGLARSPDGRSFADEGIVWSGSGELGEDGASLEHELTDPVAFDDGARVHLYFTAYADRFDSDMGYTISSVGHAVSSDGANFEPAPWPFPARACVDAPRRAEDWEWFEVQAAVRPACAGCDGGALWLVLLGHRCDGTAGSFLTRTEDGTTFREPVPIALPTAPGTLLAGDGDALFLFGAYAEQSTVDAVAVVVPGELHGCP